MKKIYSLIALLVMAVSVSAQKYHIVAKDDAVRTNVDYALCLFEDSYSYASAANGMMETLSDEGCLWRFEEAGETSEDGYPLYLLYNVGLGQYWQETDFDGELDGSDVFGYIPTSAEFGSKANAMRVTVLEAESTGDNRSHALKGQGFVISRGKRIANEDGTYTYYNMAVQGTMLHFSPWHNYDWVAVELYTVAENTPQEKLQELVDRMTAEDLTLFKEGNDPGQYTKAAVDNFFALYDEAMDALLSGGKTDEEYLKLYDDLTAAREALNSAYNPLVEGYYYIVSGLEAFEEKQGSEKALFASNATTPRWNDFDPTDYSFLWKLTKSGDRWNLQNVLYDTYYSGPASDAESAECYLAKSGTVAIEFIEKAQWYFRDSYGRYLHANGHNSGAGSSGNIVTWRATGANSASAWLIRTVTDQDYIDAVIAAAEEAKKEAERQALIASLSPIISEANTLYTKLFVADVDLTDPLVTEAADVAPGEPGNQFLSNQKDASEGNYSSLIDGIIGQNDNFFHSNWHAADAAQYPDAHADMAHYLQVDISNKPVSEFVFRLSPRGGQPHQQPSEIAIYATNDTTGYSTAEDKWTTIATLEVEGAAVGEYYTSPVISLGASYKYIRFVVTKVRSGNKYFCIGEFNLYPITISEDLSQYYYVEGMKEAAEDMMDKVAAARKVIDDKDITEAAVKAAIADLEAAIAGVKALYADPSEMIAGIAAAKAYADKATIGSKFGNIKTKAALDALDAAIAAAEEINTEGKLIKSDIDKAAAALAAAQKAFLEDMVVPEAGKWYNIVSQCPEDQRAGLLGSAMYVNVAGNTADVLWTQAADGEMDGQAVAMWQFIPVEGDTPNVFYLQNMATGLYMGNEGTVITKPGNSTEVTTTSVEPIPFQVAFIGGDDVAIVSQKDNTINYALHAQANGKAVVGWSYADAAASFWTFTEIGDDVLEAGISIPVVAGGAHVQVLPFAVEDLAENNADDAKFYAVKNMTLNEETDETTVELYEKDHFEAGEPFIVEVAEGVTEILMYAPATDELVTKAGAKNGLVGVLRNTAVEAGNAMFAFNADSTETVLQALTAEGTAPSLKGYVDAAKFTGNVADATTAKSYIVTGLKWPDGGNLDVNGDGDINSSDVVAIYDYITNREESNVSAAAADANGDGDVNSSDVVAIYDYITNNQ